MNCCLVVDVGNTRAKVAVMQGIESLCEYIVEDCDVRSFAPLFCELIEKWSVQSAIVSSTRGEDVTLEIRAILQKMLAESNVLVFGVDTPVPIKNSYGTPNTLGRDRLAAAIGAQAIMAERLGNIRDAIVVDLGTAMTMDIVTEKGGFEGGVISPGISMRFKALSEYTAKLPFIEPTIEEFGNICKIAKTTREAIVEGVLGGVAAEIDSFVNNANVNNANKKGFFCIFLTGGGAKHFEKRIKNAIFANEDTLVSIGLSKILEYNI